MEVDMKRNSFHWPILSIISGIAILIWIILFPLGLKQKIESVNKFLQEGAPSLVRMDMINQGLFFRSNLITGYRGLYQPLVSFISKNIDGEQFLPNSSEFAKSLVGKSEVLSTFLLDKSGSIIQFGENRVSDKELITSFKNQIEQWKNEELSNLYFGGHARLNYINDSLGGLLIFPSIDGEAVGDTAVGLVFNPDWFIKRLPSLIDSLRNESTMFSLYLKPKNKVKYDLGFGAISGEDTLTWWGDRLALNLEDPYHRDMLHEYSPIPAPNVRVAVIFGERLWYDTVLKSVSSILQFFTFNLIGLFVIVLMLIYLVTIFYVTYKRQSILFAHYGYTIKMPVSRLGLLVESIVDRRFDSTQHEEELLSQLKSESDKLILASRTTYSAMKRKNRAIKTELTDLNGWLRNVVEKWKTNIESSGIQYVVEIPESSLLGKWNTENIEMALDNLIDNAVKQSTMDEADRIIIRASQHKQDAVIEVIDSGIGVPIRFRKKVFRPFYIIPEESHRFVSGIGLGLYQAKQLINRIGGRIKIGTNPEGGSIFSIVLPIR